MNGKVFGAIHHMNLIFIGKKIMRGKDEVTFNAWPYKCNYLILHRKTAHSHGCRKVNISAFHVTNIVTREAFGYCRFTGVWLVKLWLVFWWIFSIVLLLLNDDTTSDNDETKKNSNRHWDDEIKVITFVMFCETRQEQVESQFYVFKPDWVRELEVEQVFNSSSLSRQWRTFKNFLY